MGRKGSCTFLNKIEDKTVWWCIHKPNFWIILSGFLSWYAVIFLNLVWGVNVQMRPPEILSRWYDEKKKTWIMFWYKTSVPGYFMLSDKLSTICLCFMFLLWNKLLLLCTKHRKKNFLSTFYLCPTQGTLFNFQGAIRACHVSTRAKHCRNQSRQADAAQQGIFKHRKSLLNPLKSKNKK